jgi:sulfur-oxidizing protein SoxX
MARFARAAAALLSLALPCAAQTPTALELFTRADKGACAACHQLPAGVAPASRADVGPALDGTRMRALGVARLREVLADPTRANPDTVMPPYGRHRILEPDELARLVEFLHALP